MPQLGQCPVIGFRYNKEIYKSIIDIEYAGVAQLVEQRFRKPQVVSSILTASFEILP